MSSPRQSIRSAALDPLSELLDSAESRNIFLHHGIYKDARTHRSDVAWIIIGLCANNLRVFGSGMLNRVNAIRRWANTHKECSNELMTDICEHCDAAISYLAANLKEEY